MGKTNKKQAPAGSPTPSTAPAPAPRPGMLTLPPESVAMLPPRKQPPSEATPDPRDLGLQDASGIIQLTDNMMKGVDPTPTPSTVSQLSLEGLESTLTPMIERLVAQALQDGLERLSSRTQSSTQSPLGSSEVDGSSGSPVPATLGSPSEPRSFGNVPHVNVSHNSVQVSDATPSEPGSIGDVSPITMFPNQSPPAPAPAPAPEPDPAPSSYPACPPARIPATIKEEGFTEPRRPLRYESAPFAVPDATPFAFPQVAMWRSSVPLHQTAELQFPERPPPGQETHYAGRWTYVPASNRVLWQRYGRSLNYEQLPPNVSCDRDHWTNRRYPNGWFLSEDGNYAPGYNHSPEPYRSHGTPASRRGTTPTTYRTPSSHYGSNHYGSRTPRPSVWDSHRHPAVVTPDRGPPNAAWNPAWKHSSAIHYLMDDPGPAPTGPPSEPTPDPGWTDYGEYPSKPPPSPNGGGPGGSPWPPPSPNGGGPGGPSWPDPNGGGPGGPSWPDHGDGNDPHDSPGPHGGNGPPPGGGGGGGGFDPHGDHETVGSYHGRSRKKRFC